MIKEEWSSPYNPFNTFKALIWREWFEGIVNGEFLPPVTLDTDPSNICNFKCIWCNSYQIHCKDQMLPEEHLIALAKFYGEWGIKSTCVAGGGEPLTNPGFNNFIIHLSKNKVQSGVVTNGSLMTDDHINTIVRNSRFCGFSMDAGKPETYAKVKGLRKKQGEQIFIKVVDNIAKMAKEASKFKSEFRIGYKYLIHPDNALEIYDAAVLAKNLGIDDFHLRPVGWDNINITRKKDPISFKGLLDEINDQIQRALELEDNKFKFFGVRHKFSPDMKKKVNFSKCRALPLHLTFGADGNVHLCFDRRGDKDLILCKHFPEVKEVLTVWGSDYHKEMMDKINPEKDCPRCTLGPHQEIIEKVFMKDDMCRMFP